MTRYLVAMAALVGPLLLGACEITEGTPECGLAEDDTYEANNPVAITASLQGGFLSSGKRTFKLQVPVLENLCVAAPEKDNFVHFNVETDIETLGLISEAYVQPAYGYEPYSLTLTDTGFSQGGSITHIGLRQGSEDGKHGYADISLLLTIPSRGDVATDLSYLVSHVKLIAITWHFEQLTPD